MNGCLNEWMNVRQRSKKWNEDEQFHYCYLVLVTTTTTTTVSRASFLFRQESLELYRIKWRKFRRRERNKRKEERENKFATFYLAKIVPFVHLVRVMLTHNQVRSSESEQRKRVAISIAVSRSLTVSNAYSISLNLPNCNMLFRFPLLLPSTAMLLVWRELSSSIFSTTTCCLLPNSKLVPPRKWSDFCSANLWVLVFLMRNNKRAMTESRQQLLRLWFSIRANIWNMVNKKNNNNKISQVCLFSSSVKRKSATFVVVAA